MKKKFILLSIIPYISLMSCNEHGFDKFYGFIGSETIQWHPLVYDGVTTGKRGNNFQIPASLLINILKTEKIEEII